MKRLTLAALAAAMLATPVVSVSADPPPWAPANGYRDKHDGDRRGHDGYGDRGRRDYSWQGGPDRRDWDASQAYRDGRYRERRLGRSDYVYRGRDNRYYCKRNDGSTGLVVGAIGGGLLGGAIGGDALGALIGAGAGGLLGRSVDRGQVRCR